MIGGDFNVIRFIHEKNGVSRITRSMRDFDDFVRCANLRDSPLSNTKYTWTNGQYSLVLCRLGRFLASGDWEDCYPQYF